MKKKKAAKPKPTAEELLELKGTETASELYILYIKHYTAGSKFTDKAREIWKKKYYQEKKKS